mmetsp:Transcript_19966/g.58786  ORF Transcript_19966/g.58786 Transcript_19966/m.58786 type:complete len:209 (-) Transcript_19966:1276-1902(-)
MRPLPGFLLLCASYGVTAIAKGNTQERPHIARYSLPLHFYARPCKWGTQSHTDPLDPRRPRARTHETPGRVDRALRRVSVPRETHRSPGAHKSRPPRALPSQASSSLYRRAISVMKPTSAAGSKPSSASPSSKKGSKSPQGARRASSGSRNRQAATQRYADQLGPASRGRANACCSDRQGSTFNQLWLSQRLVSSAGSTPAECKADST